MVYGVWRIGDGEIGSGLRGSSGIPHEKRLEEEHGDGKRGGRDGWIVDLQTVAQLWISARGRSLAAKTVATRISLVSRLAADLLRREVADLTEADLEGVFASTRGSPGWVNYCGSCFRGLLRWAHRRGYMSRDITEAWPNLRDGAVRYGRVVTREEEAAILAVAPLLLRRFIVLAIATGLRLGTLTSLTWDCVRDRWLEIPAELLKARRPLRIPLSRRAMAVLGVRLGGNERLIPLHRSSVTRSLRRYARMAGVSQEGLGAHQLRRTWVSRMRDAGATREEVQKIQGWETTSTLLRHYWPDVPAERAQELVDRL